MANIKSARKRARQAQNARRRNVRRPPEGRSAIKNVAKAVPAGDTAAAAQVLRRAQRVIDSVVAKGVLHRNAGDRHKSHLARAVKAMQSSEGH